jgi:hypothetical protein
MVRMLLSATIDPMNLLATSEMLITELYCLYSRRGSAVDHVA